MVPVRLELQNFLSYGTDAPPLDFDAFDVACLSGRNGQGKSALLDAITWAVWGKARKSSGKRKPDDELIRIGTRHMEVTFTFDLDGVRYRVQRTFTRSASGKTTQSSLEFQMQTAAGDGASSYKTLTGSTQRDTQARIDDTLGLTYETFINSAFLLQGRSDEFTKKSPSQRKEILTNILNLERYEEMGRLARRRVRKARQERDAADEEVERLKERLADVPDWKAKHAEIQEQIEEAEAHLATLREKDTRLTEQYADLEAKAREAASIRESLQQLDDRMSQHRHEIETLTERIAEADDLLAQSDSIQQDYERYEALQKERDALDETRDLHRGVERRLDQARSQLQDRKRTLESKLDRLTVERNQFRKSRTEFENALTQRGRLEKKRNEAKAARQKKRALEERREKREQIRDQIEQVERELVGQRQQLQGEYDAVQQQIEQAERTLADTSGIEQRIETLQAKAERYEALREAMAEVERDGKAVSEQLQSRTGEVEAKREALREQQEALDRFRDLDEQTCPLCGTDLTPDHRQTVERRRQEDIDQLQEIIQTRTAEVERLTEQRDHLRERYRTLQEEASALEDVPKRLATAREQHRARAETEDTLESLRTNAEALHKRIQQRAYGTDLRTKRSALRERLRDLSFDATTYERVQQTAAQVERYQERLQELETKQSRLESLTRKIKQHNARIQEIRTALDEGTAFGDLPDRIERLESQLERIDFNPERLQAVRRNLQDLRHASARMKDLVHAQQNRDDWTEQRERIRTRLAEEKEQRATYETTLESLEADLQGLDDLRKQREANATAIANAESDLGDLRQTLGQLQQRLDTAQTDRKALKAAKQRRQEAEEERTTYAHLRTAFSKHGIPSLIIEETLPDIEERANQLLDRLTDNAMRVRLDTLKQKKTGGTKETLEIIITDENGVARPYETFSGGESFRVNFALRIAMAQLLAERSGVRVRTLVIDEGFGTQDAQGIERLVDAIEAIRDDFAKVLVITHLPRLKQAFPVRIEVEKDPVTGSSFEMVGV